MATEKYSGSSFRPQAGSNPTTTLRFGPAPKKIVSGPYRREHRLTIRQGNPGTRVFRTI